MASSTLDQIEDGSRVFVDSSIFIYHFTGTSPRCRQFLEDCERNRISGITSVTAIAEVAHRLMMIEAVARGLVSQGNVARKLREKPEVVQRLRVHQDQVELIPQMRIAVLDLDLEILTAAAELRRRFGFLVNDSVLAATALRENIGAIASADQDFGRMEELRLFSPGDL